MKPRPFRAYAVIELELYARDVLAAVKLAQFRMQQLRPAAVLKFCVREET